ncbi:TPA: ABC transporter ATP-binding protein, partial [Klebsiella pneumoniae]|nr:ABC transporter ATP-binding protein [Klebsiella pneumoniae]
LHRSLKEEGHPATMIYVTHDQTEALTLGDRICVLNHGNIMQVDTPTDLYNYPNNKFVASFIGSPSINLIDTAIRKNNERLYVEIAPGVEILIPHSKQVLLEGYINKPVCFGIRPEHISLASDDDDLNTFEGVLTVVENMGSEKFLYFIVGGKELIARVDTQDINPFHIGKTLRFNLNTAFCHVFDFYNENNLTNVRV